MSQERTNLEEVSEERADVGAASEEQKLIARAMSGRGCGLAVHSNFRVGAAIEAEDGRVFTGCNIESATYPLTMCAERIAVWKALSEGARRFQRLAVVVDTDRLTPPCGSCRQIIWEFCGDIPVTLANLRGDTVTYPMRELLPHPFDEGFLEEAGREGAE